MKQYILKRRDIQAIPQPRWGHAKKHGKWTILSRHDTLDKARSAIGRGAYEYAIFYQSAKLDT